MEKGQENVLSVSDKVALQDIMKDWQEAASYIINPTDELLFYRKKFWQKVLRFLAYIVLGFVLVFCFLSLYAFNGAFTPLKALLIYTSTPKFYTYFTCVLVVLGFLRLWAKYFRFTRNDIIAMIFAFIIYLCFITQFGSEVASAFKGHTPAKIIAIFKDTNLYTTLRFIVGLSMFYALWTWISKSKKGALSNGIIEADFKNSCFDLPNFLQVHYHVRRINTQYELDKNIRGSNALTELDRYRLAEAAYHTLKDDIAQNYLSVERLEELLYSPVSVSYREELIKSR